MKRIPAIKAGILADRPVHVNLLWTLAAIAPPIAFRWAVDRGEGGIEFVTTFPAVALVALLLGWRYAVLVGLASGLIANHLFRAEPVVFYEDLRQAVVTALVLLTFAVLIWTGETVRRLVRDEEAAAERESLLKHELMHRVKNMLATVNALAMLTARHGKPGEFSRMFSGRMRALERATELLGAGGVAPCDLHRLVERALAPFHDGGRFRVEGPACELPRDACVPLALALHELCTNASKYGALSTDGGTVSLLWIVGAGESAPLRLLWQEDGGPPVAQPRRSGMGTRLLRAQRGLDDVGVEFRPEGVRCEIAIGGATPRAQRLQAMAA